MKSKFALILGLLLTLVSFNVQSSDDNSPTEKVQWVDFNVSLMDSIASGEKTATVRANHRPYLHAGPAIAKSKDGRVIDIEIERVFLTNYTWSEDAITTDILRRENMEDTTEVGFKQLFEALKYYYTYLEYGSPVTVIFFHLKK